MLMRLRLSLSQRRRRRGRTTTSVHYSKCIKLCIAQTHAHMYILIENRKCWVLSSPFSILHHLVFWVWVFVHKFEFESTVHYTLYTVHCTLYFVHMSSEKRSLEMIDRSKTPYRAQSPSLKIFPLLHHKSRLKKHFSRERDTEGKKFPGKIEDEWN